MAAISVQVPYPVFYDRDGQPLDNGNIYIGAANVDPIANPLQVYYDEALTITATQPLRTSNGYVYRNGTPAQLYVNAVNFSILVRDSKNTLVYSFPDGTGVGVNINATAVDYDPPFTGALTSGYTVADKLEQYVSVEDFGAVGNGTADDTAAIQAALDSGASEIVFTAGRTFIVDGGLDVTTNGQHILAYGATIKLKANATTKWIINSTATDVVFAGGTYDGNKANGNSSGSTYDSFCVGLYGDRCTCQDIRSINTYGIGVKGFGNYLSVLNCRISNTEHYGIFFDGSVSVSHTGNRAIGNTIDMSEGQIDGGQNIGQGILFTAGAGQAQTAWELADNNVIGPQTTVADQAINLAVRGNSGIVSNNTTRYGSMGFSEGGANTVITGNRFLNLVGTTRFGIEPSGGNTVVTGNVVTDAIRGVMVSGSLNFDNLVITGNKLDASNEGIYLQISATYTARNCIVSGNNITFGGYGIYTTRDVKNLQISSNVLVGPSATFATGRGIFIDTPPSDVYVFVTGNTITNVARPYAIYSASTTTFNKLFAIGNNLSLAGSNTNSSVWNVEGAAVVGTEVISANNVNPGTIGLQYNMIDQSSSLLTLYGAGSPEGSVTASPGSIYFNKSGGAGTTLYVKQSGSGNTGWVGK